MLAATAECAWAVHDRFALEPAGLSSLERAAVALWDFRPVAPALAAVGAFLALAGLRRPAGRLETARHQIRQLLAAVAAAYSAFALVVVVAAAWIAAAGRAGADAELAFVYTGGERVFTLVTQTLAYVPLGAFFALLAIRAAASPAPVAAAHTPPTAEEAAPTRVSEEMEALWQERLAFGPRRERARVLLTQIRALEDAGDVVAARELADEMRRL